MKGSVNRGRLHPVGNHNVVRSVALSRLNSLSHHSCSNTRAALRFSGYRKRSLLYHPLVLQKGPIAARGLCKERSSQMRFRGSNASSVQIVLLSRFVRTSSSVFCNVSELRTQEGMLQPGCCTSVLPRQAHCFNPKAPCIPSSAPAPLVPSLFRHMLGKALSKSTCVLRKQNCFNINFLKDQSGCSQKVYDQKRYVRNSICF